MAAMHVMILRSELGIAPPPGSNIMLPVGVLMAVLGNFMGKFRKNFFIGIRTPWTLASDEVWLRTHRLAGKLMVAGGAVVVLTSFSKELIGVAIAAILIASFAPLVYSYVIYKRIEGFGPNGASGA
jgi:uncharacterized membrane protein